MHTNGMIFLMSPGPGSNCCCRGARGREAEMLEIIVNLSMRCSGFYVPERLGVICRRAIKTGKIPASAFAVDAIKAFGSACWRN